MVFLPPLGISNRHPLLYIHPTQGQHHCRARGQYRQITQLQVLLARRNWRILICSYLKHKQTLASQWGGMG